MFPLRADEPSVIEFPKQPAKPAKRKSAVVGIKRSGLDLVPSTKTPKHQLASHEELANTKFRAVRKTEKAMNALGAGWHDRGIAARFADGAMCMSRKQMIEFHANVDHEQVDRLLASFHGGVSKARGPNDGGRASAVNRNGLRGARPGRIR